MDVGLPERQATAFDLDGSAQHLVKNMVQWLVLVRCLGDRSDRGESARSAYGHMCGVRDKESIETLSMALCTSHSRFSGVYVSSLTMHCAVGINRDIFRDVLPGLARS